MKKIVLILAVACVAFFASCEKELIVEPKSLVDTYWATDLLWGDTYKLAITGSTATYTYTARDGYTWTIERPYMYDPPTFTMNVDEIDVSSISGIAADSTLMLEVSIFGCMTSSSPVVLKKQEPKPEEFPAEPTIIGKWKITQSGRIVDEVINMNPHRNDRIYTFHPNVTYTESSNRGWMYESNWIQQSFEWKWDSRDRLEVTGWRYELAPGQHISIDPGDYVKDKYWTIHRLTLNELMVSYWLLPAFPHSDVQPYNEIITLERVK
ncbi:MAG: hypothetical protein LBV74_04940 [Tannerella sp.]|jgi:hypothetical protein|nr:hypothetical protein [Tannerella sp.]